MSSKEPLPWAGGPDSRESSGEAPERSSSWWPRLLAFLVAGTILVYIVLNWPALWEPWGKLVGAWIG